MQEFELPLKRTLPCLGHCRTLSVRRLEVCPQESPSTWPIEPTLWTALSLRLAAHDIPLGWAVPASDSATRFETRWRAQHPDTSQTQTLLRHWPRRRPGGS